MKTVKPLLMKSIIFVLAFTLVCGLIYPLFITGISQLFFPDRANGSIIEINGKRYGSSLLAQQFTGEEYLWGRVMKLDTETYTDANGEKLLYAVPTNLSPASEEYGELIAERVEKIRAAHPEKGEEPIPVDLITGSGSGLDPHISPAAAEYQIARVAKARGISEDTVRELVVKYTEKKLFGFLGEDGVNVLKVNLALDGILN